MTTEPGPRYEIRFQGAARRAIARQLPQAVAAAAVEFCAAVLAENPHRAGKPLFGPLARCHGARRGTYRTLYRIEEDSRVVHVLDIGHRAELYRRPQRRRQQPATSELDHAKYVPR